MKKLTILLAFAAFQASAATEIPSLFTKDIGAYGQAVSLIEQLEAPWIVLHSGAENAQPSIQAQALRLRLEMACASMRKACQFRTLPYVGVHHHIYDAINIYDVAPDAAKK